MLATWIAVFMGAVVGGAAVVGLLALKRSAEPLMALLGLIGVAVGAWGISTQATLSTHVEPLLVSLLFGVASFAGGYGLGSALLPMLSKRTQPVRLASASSSRGANEIAVIVLACIEPAQYEPAAVSEELEKLSDTGLQGLAIGITPFLYAAQKARYRTAGDSSPSTAQARMLYERVESLTLPKSRFVRFALVTCTASDTLDRVVADHAADGFNRIVVASVHIGESYAVDHAKSLVDLLRPEAHGIRIAYTAPMWGSDKLALAITGRILSGSDRHEETGVALMMNGQPEYHRRTHGAFDVQEAAFCNRIRLHLIERGMAAGNIRLCSLEWRDPGVTETVRHLAALGCKRVLVVPACLPFETVATRLDLLVAVRHARVDDVVKVVTVPTWGLEPATAEALADAVKEAAVDLLAAPVI